MVIVLVSTAVLLALGLVEASRHRRNLNGVPMRILVNGTRGKTSLARLLVASLNAQGIRTMGRTTGSEASTILPSGAVVPIVRRRGARVYELVRFFEDVSKESSRGVRSGDGPVQCVVVECMALQAENQKAFRDWLVRPTHVFVTNTYVDHVPEMGLTREDTSKVLGLSIPKDCTLYTTEHFYDGLSSRVVHVCEPAPLESPLIHPDCMAMAWAFLKDQGMDVRSLERGVEGFVPDKGLLSPFPVGRGSLFVPTFSVNDETCMELAIRKWCPAVSHSKASTSGKVSVVFNNRGDREYRILLFRNVLRRNIQFVDDVLVVGDYPRKAARAIGNGAVACTVQDVCRTMANSGGKVFVGLGNIKGEGERIIETMQAMEVE